MASNNIINFLIKLQGNAANAITAAQQVDRHLAAVERRASAVGGALKKAFSLSNFSSALMSVPGMQFLTNPYTMAAAAVGAVAKVGMEAENTAASFKVLLGSQEAAKSMLDALGAMDARKVYGVDALKESTKLMLNFGVDSKKVLTYLKSIGNIAGGDKQKMQSLALVLGQVVSMGYLQGTDKNQFINAGWNPLLELQKMTGKSMDELNKMMSKNQISAEMVAQALAHATEKGGQFYGMIDELSQSTEAKISDLFSELRVGAEKLWVKIQPIFNDVINLVQKIIPPVMSVAENIVGAIVWVIDKIKEWKTEIGLLLVTVGTFFAVLELKALVLLGVAKLLTTLKTVVAAVTTVWKLFNLALMANPIGVVVGLVAALAAAVVYCWNEFAGFRAFLITAWDTLMAFGVILKNFVVDRIIELITGIGELGSALKKLFEGDFEGAWNTAKGAVSKILGFDSFNKALNASIDAYNNISKNWEKNYEAEQKKEGNQPSEVSEPGLVGSESPQGTPGDTGGGTGKTVSDVVTGGQRSTAITMNIGKFFDNINVYMADVNDTAALEQMILETLNRALAVATSADR